MVRNLFAIFAVILASALLIAPIRAQQAELTGPASPDEDNAFGSVVSISNEGGRLVIADPTYGSLCPVDPGRLHVFGLGSEGGWSRDTSLSASGGYLGGGLGRGTSISGNGQYIIASSKGPATAHVFALDQTGTWLYQAALRPPEEAIVYAFGDVAISSEGERAIVGVVRHNVAYVFKREGNVSWVLEDTLAASEGRDRRGFGKSVSISKDGRRAVVGAYPSSRTDVHFDRGAYRRPGAAYVFVLGEDDRWEQTAKTTDPSQSGSHLRFGQTVAIGNHAERIFVGATIRTSAKSTPVRSGKVYVFSRDGRGMWTQEAELVPSDGKGSEESSGGKVGFGSSIAASSDGQLLLVGAPGSPNTRSRGHGRVYLFARSQEGWSQKGKMDPPNQEGHGSNGLIQSGFGTSVSISGRGRRVLIGDPSGKDGGEKTEKDRAYVAALSAFTKGGTDDPSEDEPKLIGSYPNPFRRKAAIVYELSEATNVRLTVYDILGRRVRTLVDERQSAGKRTVTFKGHKLPSGLYIFRLQVGGYTKTGRLMHVK